MLALGESALERLAAVTDVVFDKTGTLGDGHPVLSEVTPMAGHDRDGVLAIAAALESDSGHPLARAFAGTGPAGPATNVRAVPGQGIEGDVDGVRWRLGRAGFAAGQDDDDAIWLGDGSRAAARFRVQEATRPDAAEAVALLGQMGIRVHLSSGDAGSQPRPLKNLPVRQTLLHGSRHTGLLPQYPATP